MGDYGSQDTLCPFYRREDKNAIKCEGIMDDSFISQYFCKSKDKQIHKDVFCNHRYGNCEIYRMLMSSKYKEE